MNLVRNAYPGLRGATATRGSKQVDFSAGSRRKVEIPLISNTLAAEVERHRNEA